MQFILSMQLHSPCSIMYKTFMLCACSGYLLATSFSAANALPLNGFYSYHVGRSQGKRDYSSIVYLKSSHSEVSIFRVIEEDPLGSLWRCGGLGCKLKAQEKIGNLSLKRDANGFKVIKAGGAAGFLLSSSCLLSEAPLGYAMECKSENSPWQQNSRSFAIFNPGS